MHCNPVRIIWIVYFFPDWYQNFVKKFPCEHVQIIFFSNFPLISQLAQLDWFWKKNHEQNPHRFLVENNTPIKNPLRN